MGLAELSIFHVYLAARRISTYEYIVAQVPHGMRRSDKCCSNMHSLSYTFCNHNGRKALGFSITSGETGV